MIGLLLDQRAVFMFPRTRNWPHILMVKLGLFDFSGSAIKAAKTDLSVLLLLLPGAFEGEVAGESLPRRTMGLGQHRPLGRGI